MTPVVHTAGHFRTVRVSDVTPSFFNAREQNMESLESENFLELCDSIRMNGLIEPIVVRATDSGYEAVAGTRRLLALKHVGAKEAPVIVKEMSDNDVRIMSLGENVHRKYLTEDEKKAALEAIYLGEWHKWRPENWDGKDAIMPREKNRRTGEVATYDLRSDTGRLVLAKQYLGKLRNLLHRERTLFSTSDQKKFGKGRPEEIFPTEGFKVLRERIGYAAGTQYNILAGFSSGSTRENYIEELSPILRRQFDEDERIRRLDEEKRKELAKKIYLATRSRKRKTKVQKAQSAAKKFFRDLEGDKEADKRQPGAAAAASQSRPETESNAFRVRQEVLTLCVKLFKLLTGMEVDDSTLTSGERQLSSTQAKRTMQEIATFYPQKGELIGLQSVVIPVNKALSAFRDYVYESIEAQKKNEHLFKP